MGAYWGLLFAWLGTAWGPASTSESFDVRAFIASIILTGIVMILWGAVFHWWPLGVHREED